MRSAPRHVLLLGVLSFVCLLPVAAGADQPKPEAVRLSEDDKKMLAGLIKDFLFDPQGAQRVQVKALKKSVEGKLSEMRREGWLVAGKNGEPDRVYFTDGENVPVGKDTAITKVDFVRASQANYSRPQIVIGDGLYRQERLAEMGLPDLAVAAWLHRLGEDDLAAAALAAARAVKGDPRQVLEQILARRAFGDLVVAFLVRADDEALAHGERLLRLYPNLVKKDYQQAEQVVADLKRRQKANTLGRPSVEQWPDGFDGWVAEKKISFLIDTLDEFDARKVIRLFDLDLTSDRRAKELIRLGDLAVPPLIDLLEKDDRLTRAVRSSYNLNRDDNILSVREVALKMIEWILRTDFFEPRDLKESFTKQGQQGAREMAAKLRAYWNQYGNLPFDERMMAVLTDSKGQPKSWRKAAYNLAHLADEGRPAFNPSNSIEDFKSARPSPAVAKFRNPTTAEAIIAALDRERDMVPTQERKDSWDGYYSADSYLFPLIYLGDTRSADVCGERSRSAKTALMRLKWAFTALGLGDPKPLQGFANDFREGKVELPKNEEEGSPALRSIIGFLIIAGTPETELALFSLVEPKHAWHQAIARKIRESDSTLGFEWFMHPFCLAFLRADLSDGTPTGVTFRVENERLIRRTKEGESEAFLLPFLADPTLRAQKVEERACDAAAAKLSELVFGLPEYHPLRKDTEIRLVALREAYDLAGGRARKVSDQERDGPRNLMLRSRYILDLKPLAEPATVEDVKAGRAVFHLDGRGKRADLDLPAVALLKRRPREASIVQILVLQAEIGPDGEVIYGGLGRDGMQNVTASEVEKVTPLSPKRPVKNQ